MLEQLDKRWPSLRKKLFVFIPNINPNLVSVGALLLALVAGFLFWKGFIFLAGAFVLLNTLFDLLDGGIATKYSRRTVLGDFLDHTFDRLADVAIFVGIALSVAVPAWLGFGALIAVLLVSYLGTQAQALTGERLYTAIAGRGDRLIILIGASWLTYFWANALYYGALAILVLSALTFCQRFLIILRKLKS